MKRWQRIGGITVATLTIVIAVFTPFVLIGGFSRVVAATGLRINEGYVGGPIVRTIERNGSRIVVHAETRPRFLQRIDPFVQVNWEPPAVLPPIVSDDVDLNGDGRPDVHVEFSPRPIEKIRVEVRALNPRYTSFSSVGKDSFSRLISKVGESIEVRIPLAKGY